MNKYNEPKLEVIVLDTQDVIKTSGLIDRIPVGDEVKPSA